MQAIQTKYHGPTNTRDSRITAKCASKRITVSYDHALDIEGNHVTAARKLAEVMDWLTGWHGSLLAGSLPDGSYVHVFVRAPMQGHILTVEPGREIHKDGVPFIRIVREGADMPADIDDVTHTIATLLSGRVA
jgi:hypothetical protein